MSSISIVFIAICLFLLFEHIETRKKFKWYKNAYQKVVNEYCELHDKFYDVSTKKTGNGVSFEFSLKPQYKNSEGKPDDKQNNNK